MQCTDDYQSRHRYQSYSSDGTDQQQEHKQRPRISGLARGASLSKDTRSKNQPGHRLAEKRYETKRVEIFIVQGRE
uniref:Uncharacterized protein n=1 Tax=Anopheles coluzzii TaxID=1518534 RepID=A0A8W7PLI6_ANOCL